MDAKLLQRVVPIAMTQAWGHGQLGLVSLEIHDDGSILRYRLLGQGRLTPEIIAAESLASAPMFMAEDDFGTDYFTFFSGGGGGDNDWQCSAHITPAIPEGAGNLRISARQPLNVADDKASGRRITFDIGLS